MIELDKTNYDEVVGSTDKLLVVDFWGTTCAPCMALKPIIEQYEKEFEGRAVFAELNIQGNRRLAMREQVMGLPTILFYKGGEKIDSLIVNFSPPQLKKKIEELL
ncbi:MAG: thioredoxin family protein [Spirochaetales bacterium]|nr:thioredoxin family protein [Spirochaetales bacterium]